jgi:hypothetical protein
MEDVGIFCGHLVNFSAIWYILWPFDKFGIFSGHLVYCTNEDLASCHCVCLRKKDVLEKKRNVSILIFRNSDFAPRRSNRLGLQVNGRRLQGRTRGKPAELDTDRFSNTNCLQTN